MRSITDTTCILLAVFVFEVPYSTGHVSPLGDPFTLGVGGVGAAR